MRCGHLFHPDDGSHPGRFDFARALVAPSLGVFAGIAIVLAAVGLYGAIARTVTDRTHEIGVRLALGATRSKVLATIGREALTMIGLGLILGIVGAAIAAICYEDSCSALDQPTRSRSHRLIRHGSHRACGLLPTRTTNETSGILRSRCVPTEARPVHHLAID